MNEFAVIRACFQSGCVYWLVAQAAMVTIENARGDSTIFKSFFRHSFSSLSCINYNESETLIIYIQIHDPKFDLFLSPYQKDRF